LGTVTIADAKNGTEEIWRSQRNTMDNSILPFLALCKPQKPHGGGRKCDGVSDRGVAGQWVAPA
jgi:hypothetical protein